jgi:hypothetical protein
VTKTEAIRLFIKDECEKVKTMLLKKNEDYGASVFAPVRIFSTSSDEEQLLVRIDDKLSRIQNMGWRRILLDKDPTAEDTIEDLIGYLVLLKAKKRLHNSCGMCFQEDHGMEECGMPGLLKSDNCK